MYSTVLNIESSPIHSTTLIYHGDKTRFNSRVNRKEIRLNNLRKLIGEAKSAAELARKVGTDPAYLSQLVNRVPTPKGTIRGVGDVLVDRLEKAMGKPTGWMDQDHSKAKTEYSERERMIMEMFRGLSEEGKKDIQRHIDAVTTKERIEKQEELNHDPPTSKSA